jgi:hypothetical protein
MSPLSIAATAPRLDLERLAAASIESSRSSGQSTQHVASFDGDWCPTKPKFPFPPRPHWIDLALLGGRAEAAGLNPQPLPPRESVSALASPAVRSLLMDECGTVPLKLRFPFPPPPQPGRVDSIDRLCADALR